LHPLSDAQVVRMGVGALSLMACLLFTVPAVIGTFALAGAGHGSQFYLHTLFPYTKLNIFDRYPVGFYSYWLLQFPIYGIIIFVAAWRGWVWYGLALALIIGSHVVAYKLLWGS
jgi:hypothetical protein